MRIYRVFRGFGGGKQNVRNFLGRIWGDFSLSGGVGVRRGGMDKEAAAPAGFATAGEGTCYVERAAPAAIFVCGRWRCGGCLAVVPKSQWEIGGPREAAAPGWSVSRREVYYGDGNHWPFFFIRVRSVTASSVAKSFSPRKQACQRTPSES